MDAFISQAIGRGREALSQIPQGGSSFLSPLVGRESSLAQGLGSGYGKHVGTVRGIADAGSQKWQSAVKHLPTVALGVGGAALVKNLYDRWQSKQMKREILKNPRLTDKYDPKEIQEAVEAVNKYAPSLSGDKNTVTNTVKRMLEYDGVNVEDVKQLMDLEKLYQESLGAGSTLFRPITDLAKLVI